MNIVIPMAGSGTRFTDAGYKLPKPLIDVNGSPMIKAVLDNLRLEGNYIFIVRKEHRDNYNIDELLSGYTIIETEGLTEGAACSVLLAEKYIDNDDPLLIANSDQILDWEPFTFLVSAQTDGSIVTFKSKEDKWSYVKTKNDIVTEVAEKKVISDTATSGIYYWNKGKDFVYYTKQMISKNIRVNNEFYVCPVFNEAIKDGLKFNTFDIKKMWGIGTPEDLENYLKKDV